MFDVFKNILKLIAPDKLQNLLDPHSVSQTTEVETPGFVDRVTRFLKQETTAEQKETPEQEVIQDTESVSSEELVNTLDEKLPPNKQLDEILNQQQEIPVEETDGRTKDIIFKGIPEINVSAPKEFKLEGELGDLQKVDELEVAFTDEDNLSNELNPLPEEDLDEVDAESAPTPPTTSSANDLTDADEAIAISEDDSITQGFNLLDNTYNPDGPNPAEVSINSTPIITTPTEQSVNVVEDPYPNDGEAAKYNLEYNGHTGTLIIFTDGSVTFTNDDPNFPVFDFLGDGETAQIHIDYTVTDGAETVTSTATIDINGNNDLTDADEVYNVVQETQFQNLDMVWTLDLSGSMAWGATDGQSPAPGEMSRLELAVASYNNLADQYITYAETVREQSGEIPEIYIHFIGFSTNVSNTQSFKLIDDGNGNLDFHADGDLSGITLEQYMGNLTTVLWTNYRLAIEEALAYFNDPDNPSASQEDFTRIHYFLSDGVPQGQNNSNPNPPADTGQQFANLGVESYAIGMFTPDTATQWLDIVDNTPADGLTYDGSNGDAQIAQSADEVEQVFESLFTIGKDIVPPGELNLLDNTYNPDGPNAATVEQITSIQILDNDGSDISDEFTLPIFPVAPGTYTIIHTATGNTADLIVTENGNVTFTNISGNLFGFLGGGDNAQVVITYDITDGTDTDQSTATINVTKQNLLGDDNDEITISEDNNIIFNILDNTYNPDGPDAAMVADITGFQIFDSSDNNISDSYIITQVEENLPDGAIASYIIADISQAGQPATLTIFEDGTVKFDNSGHGPFDVLTSEDSIKIKFDYTVTDGVDTVQSTATINIEGKTDSLLLGTDNDDTLLSASHGVVAIGDLGNNVQNFDMVWTLDLSGSMAWGSTDNQSPAPGEMSRLELAVASYNNLADQYIAYAETVREQSGEIPETYIHFIGFSTDASNQQTFKLVEDGNGNLAFRANGDASGQTLQGYMDNLQASGWTNYAFATDAALDYFNDSNNPSAGQEDFTRINYFLSDGVPAAEQQVVYSSTHPSSRLYDGNPQYVVDFPVTGAQQVWIRSGNQWHARWLIDPNPPADTGEQFAELGVESYAIGMFTPDAATQWLDIVDNTPADGSTYDGSNGDAQIAQSADEVEQAFNSLFRVGEDIIAPGEDGAPGGMTVFGDFINPDYVDASNPDNILTLGDFTGNNYYDQLVNLIGAKLESEPSEQDIISYIKANWMELGKEPDGGLGADDYIVGSETGKNFLAGQGGDDTIIGGTNDDIIIGGTGADTLTGGGGQDTFVYFSNDLGTGVDTITDFNVEGDDKLDFRDLFANSSFDSENDDLSDFVDITWDGSDLVVSFDTDGSSPETAVDVVKLENFTPGNDITVVVGDGQEVTFHPPES